MIAGTYLLSGILLLITAYLFGQGALNATTIAICWPVVLFFASAARPLTAPDAAAAPHGR
jgi:hypothetical protein